MRLKVATKQEVELGDKVKCKYTGFEGIAVARTEFINGCVQISIASKWDGKSPEPFEIAIDEKSLIVVRPKPKQGIRKETGGANRRIKKMRGY